MKRFISAILGVMLFTCVFAEESGWQGLSDSDVEPAEGYCCGFPISLALYILFIFLSFLGVFAWLCWILVKWITNGKEPH